MNQFAALRRFAVISVVGLLCCSAGAYADQTVVNWGETDPAAGLRFADKGQSVKQDSFEDKPALRVEWDGQSAPFLESAFKKAAKLPEFSSAQITLHAYVPQGAPLSQLNIRLCDKDGEIFQFTGKVPASANGWVTLTYEVDAEKPSAGIWGGKNPNKKIDFPATINGIGIDFRNKASGYVGLGLVELKNLTPAASQQTTTTEISRNPAENAPFAKLTDLGESNPGAGLRYADKGQSQKQENLEGKAALRFDWDGTQAPYLESGFSKGVRLPVFHTAKIRLHAYVPEEVPLSMLNIRLMDKDGEIFQFAGKVSATDHGWVTLTYTIDAEKPQAGVWGGKSQNKKLDFPVSLAGIGIDFRNKASGYVGLGLVEIQVISAPVSGSLQTGTGSPVNVLKQGEEKELALVLHNPANTLVTRELHYSVASLISGEQIIKKKETVNIPASGQLRVALTPPERFGVYRIDYELRDGDKIDSALSTRFAYMIPAGPTKEPASGFLFGVCGHPQRYPIADQEREALAAALCGAKVLREDVLWEYMERNPGQWSFDRFDRVVDIFGKQGIEIAPIYSYSPKWASATDITPPEELTQYLQEKKRTGKPLPDFKHWENFIRTFANRYGNRIRYYEVWNEPDLPTFAYFSEESYAELLKIAYRETKKARPDAVVLSGGLAGLMRNGKYIEKLIPLINGYFDVFAFHGHGTYDGYVPTIIRLAEIRGRLGDHAPWYSNETAISSMSVGEMKQAETLFKKLIFAWTMGSVGYNWYDLRNDGFNPKDNEHHFGMITQDFQPKLVYAAYANLANHLQNAKYMRPLIQKDTSEAYLFAAANGDYVIPNWSSSPTLGALSGITGQAQSVDMWGNVAPLAVEGGILATSLSTQPTMILIKKQTGEPRWENEIIKTPGDMVLKIGRETQFPIQFNNPGNQPLQIQWSLKTPEGIDVKPQRGAITLQAKKSQNIETAFLTAAGYRMAGNEAKMSMQLTLGAMWQGTLDYKIKTACIIQKDYHDAPDFVLDHASQNTSLVVNAPENKALFWTGADDLSSKIWLASDARSLQIKVVVKDDIHHQTFTGDNVWNGDNVQFAIKLPEQNSLWEMGLALNNDGHTETFVWIAPQGFNRQNVAAAIRLTASRDEKSKLTTYEASVPFSAIGMTESEARSGFRFNLLVNDNDGPIREGFMAIAPGMGTSQESKDYPILVLD